MYFIHNNLPLMSYGTDNNESNNSTVLNCLISHNLCENRRQKMECGTVEYADK